MCWDFPGNYKAYSDVQTLHPSMELRSTALGQGQGRPWNLRGWVKGPHRPLWPKPETWEHVRVALTLTHTPQQSQGLLSHLKFLPLLLLHTERQESLRQRVWTMELNCLVQILAWFSSCVWPRASLLTALGLSFHISEVGIIIALSTEGYGG